MQESDQGPNEGGSVFQSNLPIEAKRHYHKDLWIAGSVQLQGYASDEKADGFGILLVFWFGDWQPTPTRKDGAKPESAAELEALLVSDLPAELQAMTDVVVLDVAAPHRVKTPKPAVTKAKPAPGQRASRKSRT